jgi:UDP-N-acetylmuramoylalanine--D-glutamate ligase
MKIAILGFAGQGQAAWDYWNKPGNEITICDRHKSVKVPDGAHTHLGENYLHGLDKFDLLVRTPALHPDEIVKANPKSPDILKKVTTVTNEFLKVCPSKNIIGVTGTKGKGTTSSLIAKMLEASGKRVHLGGNIGIPPLNMLKNNIHSDDWVVLELANFQLIDLKHSPHIGVCLMVVPEHMDWHVDMDEYITAKQQLFIHQESDDIAIYFAESPDSLKVVSAGAGWKVPYFATPGAVVDGSEIFIENKAVCSIADVKLLGNHNLQNICAAITAFWQVVQDKAAIQWVVSTFAGLEHRLEYVKEVDGVKYYDDSFGTTPETAMVAIEAFEEPKVVILGGSDKGARYDKLAETVRKHNVRTAIVIGATGHVIKKAIKGKGFEDVIDGPDTMPEIVKLARKHAKKGDVVLLSTGSASFGLFENYKDRGDQFKKAVKSL